MKIVETMRELSWTTLAVAGTLAACSSDSGNSSEQGDLQPETGGGAGGAGGEQDEDPIDGGREANAAGMGNGGSYSPDNRHFSPWRHPYW